MRVEATRDSDQSRASQVKLALAELSWAAGRFCTSKPCCSSDLGREQSLGGAAHGKPLATDAPWLRLSGQPARPEQLSDGLETHRPAEMNRGESAVVRSVAVDEGESRFDPHLRTPPVEPVSGFLIYQFEMMLYVCRSTGTRDNGLTFDEQAL